MDVMKGLLQCWLWLVVAVASQGATLNYNLGDYTLNPTNVLFSNLMSTAQITWSMGQSGRITGTITFPAITNTWTNFTVADYEGGTVYGIADTNPIVSTATFAANYLTNFLGNPSTLIKLGTGFPGFKLDERSKMASIIMLGDDLFDFSTFTNVYRVSVLGNAAGDSAMWNGVEEVVVLGRALRNSLITNSSIITAVGGQALEGADVWSSSSIYGLGTKAFDEATISNCVQIAAIGNNAFGFQITGPILRNSDRLTAVGDNALKNSIIENSDDIFGAGPSAGAFSRLTNCIGILFFGKDAGTNLVLTAKTNIMLFGNIGAVSPANEEMWFGNSTNRYVMPGIIWNGSLTPSTVLRADASTNIVSIPNGTGALTNNGSGTLGWFSLVGLCCTNLDNLTVTNLTQLLGLVGASTNNPQAKVHIVNDGGAARDILRVSTNGGTLNISVSSNLIFKLSGQTSIRTLQFGDDSSGWSRTGGNDWDFWNNGSIVMNFGGNASTADVTLSSVGQHAFSSAVVGTTIRSTADSGTARQGVAHVRVSNGGSGIGSLTASNITAAGTLMATSLVTHFSLTTNHGLMVGTNVLDGGWLEVVGPQTNRDKVDIAGKVTASILQNTNEATMFGLQTNHTTFRGTNIFNGGWNRIQSPSTNETTHWGTNIFDGGFMHVTGNQTNAGFVRATNGLVVPSAGGLALGTGATITNILSASAALTFTAVGAQRYVDASITVTGTTTNDACFLGVPFQVQQGVGGTNLIFSPFTSNDTVWVRCNNYGTATRSTNGVFNVLVFKR